MEGRSNLVVALPDCTRESWATLPEDATTGKTKKGFKGTRAAALAISGIAKKHSIRPKETETLETKYDDGAGD